MSRRTSSSLQARSLGGRRWRAPAVVAALAVGCTMTGSGIAVAGDHSHGAPDPFVAAWDLTATQAIGAAGFNPVESHVMFAYVAIAEYDAAVAVHGRGDHFAVDADAPRGASAEAAVSTAAHRVLAHYLPAQKPTILDPAYQAALASIPDGSAETAGVAVGERVAAALIELRRDDGFRAAVPYTPPVPVPVGTWIPTAPTPPVGTFLPAMRPFALRSADQFRPDGPPNLDSRRWAKDYAEVAALGSATSPVRTPDQTAAALFWGEPPFTQAHASFRLFIDEHDLDLAIGHHVQRIARIITEDDHRPLGIPPFPDQGSKSRQVGLGEAAEERNPAEDMDGRQVHGGVRSGVTGRYLRLDRQVKGPGAPGLLCDP